MLENAIFECRIPNTFSFVCRGIIVIFSLVSNMITIIALLRSHNKTGRNAKLYIISLTCADILLSPAVAIGIILFKTGACCLPIYEPYHPAMAHLVTRMRLAKIIVGIFFVLPIGSSLFTLLSLAVDCLLTVSKPLFYRNQISTFRIKCWLVIVWSYIFILITSTMIYFGLQSSPEHILRIYDCIKVLPDWCYSFVILPHLYFAITGNIIAYCATFYHLRRLTSRITVVNPKGEVSQQTKQYARMGFATLGFMLLLWTPYMVLTNLVDAEDPSTPSYLVDYILPLGFFIMYCNSWINPIIYCWLNKDYHSAYLDLLCMKCRFKDTSHKPGTEIALS